MTNKQKDVYNASMEKYLEEQTKIVNHDPVNNIRGIFGLRDAFAAIGFVWPYD